MKRATISELKNQLSKFLGYVKHGEPVVILDRGHPIADILPHKAGDSKGEEQIARIEALGIIRRGNPNEIKKYLPPDSTEPTGLLQTLLEERASSR
mgnify:CR=1 FL=1